MAKHLCGLQSSSTNDVPPLTDLSHTVTLDDRQKANLLNDTFRKQTTSLIEKCPVGPTDVTSTINFKGFSADNVRRAVRSLPNKTSTGTDQNSHRLLKEAGPAVVGPLTTSFNCSLRLRQVPKEWKKAVIIPVFEGGLKDRRV